MDLKRWLVWLAMMLGIALAYSVVYQSDYVPLLLTWWPTALVSAVVIYYAPHWTEDPDENPYWLVWALCMAVYLTLYGGLMLGDWWGVMLWWHWGVAALSAMVMHYAAPWGRKYLPV